MGKKPWRNPANPGYKNPAVDTSTAQTPSPEDIATAQALLGPPEPGTDRYAVKLLLRTAEFLDEFVQQARAALKKVAPEKLDAILKQAEIEPAQTAPQKRPRGAAHPIQVLHSLGVAAARLLKQILKATNPGLFTLSPDKADLLGLARQSHDFTAHVNRKKAEGILAAAGG